MTTAFPYTLQPQPPPHPRVVGSKRGPSGPISIPTSSSEDEDSDQSIGDFSPPVPSRLTTLGQGAHIVGHVGKVPVINAASPRGRKFTGLVVSPRTGSNVNNNNNNSATVNLNHLNNTTNTTNITISSSSGNNSSPSVCNFLVTDNSPPSPSEETTVCTTILEISSTSSTSLPASAPQQTTSLPPASSTSASPVSQSPSGKTSAVIPNSSSQTSDSQAGNSTSLTGNTNIVTSPPYLKEEVDVENPASSPQNRSCSPPSNFAYEHDHDYENVASPCSSTASGPIYVRPPGFQHHAQEITLPPSFNKLKKKKTSAALINHRDGFKKREQTPPKLKPKRDPLPMKLRALPQSFWQQPNVPHQVSPASLFPILPPLSQKENEEIMEFRPVTPPDDRDSMRKVQQPERKLTVANTDLLFKLFEGVGEDRKGGQSKARRQIKSKKPTPKSNTKGLFLGNDPYLVEDVTDKIFPQLTLEGSRHSGMGGNTSLQLITLKEGDRTVTLPSLSTEQNYPQMLSELVMHI